MRHGDFDWVHWIDTCLNVAMHGHQTEMYDAAFRDFFGAEPPRRIPGFPVIRGASPNHWCSGCSIIVNYHLNFNFIWKYSDKLYSGLLLSLELAFVSILIGCLIGLGLAVGIRAVIGG
jgi:ABC-type amino acid transport system permease subunit